MDLVSFKDMFRMFWLILINPFGSDVGALKQLVIPEKLGRIEGISKILARTGCV